jgi:hypothetical protein
MRVTVILGVFLCLALIVAGAYWTLLEQRQVASYSARTTAVVLAKKLDRRLRPITESRGSGSRRFRADHDDPFRYKAIVSYRYEAGGRRYTGSSVFPNDDFIGGNLGRIAVEATLERFEVGERTAVYYDPERPWTACLIRRPAGGPYFLMLLPAVGASILIGGLWPSRPQGAHRSRQRKARLIAALWYAVGIVAAGQYLWVAGWDYSGVALTALAVYLQVGLIPLAIALPPFTTRPAIKRLKGAFGLSLAGTFIGLWLGLLIGWIAMKLSTDGATSFMQCWGYTMAITAAAFAALGWFGEWHVGEGDESPQGRSDSAMPAAPADNTADANVGAEREGAVPYRLDERTMPRRDDAAELLPVEVGPFRRDGIDASSDARQGPVYAHYHGGGGIFVELGVCGDPAEAQAGVETSKAETEGDFPDAPAWQSLGTDPSFYKTSTSRGAFISWTRGRYYFSAHARGGEDDLERFMTAFPY